MVYVSSSHVGLENVLVNIGDVLHLLLVCICKKYLLVTRYILKKNVIYSIPASMFYVTAFKIDCILKL